MSERLSVLRTSGLRSARLQIELNGLMIAVEMTADLARVVGNRLMMVDPVLLPEDRLPITEEGRVRIGMDGAVEVLGGRLQDLAQFDPLVGCDLRIGVVLVDRGVEAYANMATPAFGFLDEPEDGAAPISPWELILEKRIGAATGQQVLRQSQRDGNAGLGASTAGREGVLVATPIHVSAEDDLDMGPRRSEPSTGLGEAEGRCGDPATRRAALVHDDRVSDAQAEGSVVTPRREAVPASSHPPLHPESKNREASAP